MRHIKCKCIEFADRDDGVDYQYRTYRTGYEIFFMKRDPVAEYTFSERFPLVQVIIDNEYSAVFDTKNNIDWEFKYTFEYPEGKPFLNNDGLGFAMMKAGLTREEAEEALRQLLTPPPLWGRHEHED